jgi:hypothetical protein
MGRGSRPEPSIHRLSLSGALVDTLEAPHATFPRTPLVGSVALPFAPRHFTVWSPLGYFVTTNSARYAVDLRLSGRGDGRGAEAMWRPGDPVVSIRRTVPPVPVADDERADWRNGITAYHRGLRGGGGWEWDGPEIPRVKPPIRDVMVAADGRIWVRLSQPARLDRAVTVDTRRQAQNEIYAQRRWMEPWLFDVFEPSGRYVGQVRFPDEPGQPYMRHPGFVIQGDTVWMARYDQDDVPSIKRYRVQWGG